MRERTGQARPGRADQHCRLTAVNFSQHSERQRDLSQPQSDPGMADIVKSSYVVDPDDQMRLIRREEDGSVIDREYWDRVNQEQSFSTFSTLPSIFSFLFSCENMKNNVQHSGWKCFECSQNVWAKQPEWGECKAGASQVQSSAFYFSKINWEWN